jgi:Domain of unknown function (DUF1844)
VSPEKRGETFVMPDGAEGKPIEFTTFLFGLASAALIHLGDSPDPSTGKAEVNLPLARESIELLALLRRKTEGNLTPEEQKVFDELLADVRMRYVRHSGR